MKNKKLKDYTQEELNKLSSKEKEELLKKYYISMIVKGLIIFLFIVLLLNCITTVPTGYVGIKTRFGQVQNSMLQEGLNFKIPFIEKIVKMNCKTQIYENKNSFESSTKDMQVVTDISVAINYSVDKEMANNLYQKVGEQYEKTIINPAIQESVKLAFSQFTAEDIITNRDKVSELIKNTLKTKLESNGIKILEVSITDFDFSDEYNKAIEDKATAQQNVEKAKAELEKAQVDNQKKIENAKADAEVMELQNRQITENTLKLKELEIKQKLIEKWNGALPTTVANDILSILK